MKNIKIEENSRNSKLVAVVKILVKKMGVEEKEKDRWREKGSEKDSWIGRER